MLEPRKFDKAIDHTVKIDGGPYPLQFSIFGADGARLNNVMGIRIAGSHEGVACILTVAPSWEDLDENNSPKTEDVAATAELDVEVFVDGHRNAWEGQGELFDDSYGLMFIALGEVKIPLAEGMVDVRIVEKA